MKFISLLFCATALIFSANAASAPSAPYNLTLQSVGDSLQYVKLTWSDSTTILSGYIIERHDDQTSTYQRIARTVGRDSAFVDSQVKIGTLYFYQLLAYKASGTDTLRSGYCDEQAMTVTGIPWIRVLAPIAGQSVKAGAAYTIKWSTNTILQVQVFLSLDGGLSDTNLHPGGAIATYSPDWENFVFTMPDTECTNAMIRISRYGGGNNAYSGLFTITRNLSAGPVVKQGPGYRPPVIATMESPNRLSIRVRTDGAYRLNLFSSSGRLLSRIQGNGPGVSQAPLAASSGGFYLVEGFVKDAQVSMRVNCPNR